MQGACSVFRGVDVALSSLHKKLFHWWSVALVVASDARNKAVAATIAQGQGLRLAIFHLPEGYCAPLDVPLRFHLFCHSLQSRHTVHVVVVHQNFSSCNARANVPTALSSVEIVNELLKMLSGLSRERKFEPSIHHVAQSPQFEFGLWAIHR